MRVYRIIITMIALWLMASACREEICSDSPIRQGVWVEAPVICRPAIQMTIEEDGTLLAATRAATEAQESAVNNIWVFQFNNTTESSTLVGDPLYFTLNGSASDAQRTGTIKVTTSGSSRNRLVVIANTNKEDYKWQLLSGEATYKDLIAKTKELTSTSFPDAETVLPMVAVWDGIIDAGRVSSGFELTFSRSVVKIEFNLTLGSELEEGFSIRSVQLKQIPSQMRWCDGAIEMKDETTIFPGTLYSYVNYDAITDRLPEKGKPQKYIWYIPRNHQGISSNQVENQKNNGAKSSATYIEVLASDKEKNDYRFRLYPGKNMLNNFNLTPNCVYSLPLTINGVGDPNTDSRVEHLSKVLLPKSNSYILNPPDEGSGAKIYCIPVERVNDFWADPAYEPMGQTMEKAFTETTYWKCQVLWYDNPNLFSTTEDDKLTLLQATGQGLDNQYLRVRVPSLQASQQGNLVIGIYRTDGSGNIEGECVWSWHLWVTDYNPDTPVQISEKVHTYPVSGGQVERYGGTASGYGSNWIYTSWVSTPSFDQPYAGKLAMDRYLGTRSVDLTIANSGNYAKFPVPVYQFGRKDPLPPYGKYDIYIYENGIQSVYKNNTGKYKYILTNQITMRDAIEKPYWFSLNSNSNVGWHKKLANTVNDDALPAQYVWYDLKQSAFSPYKYDKSLFDPCPPGWRVPNTTLWKDEFTDTSGRTNTGTNGRSKLNKDIDGFVGLRYWPYKQVGAEYPVDGSIYYPCWNSVSSGGYSNYGPTKVWGNIGSQILSFSEKEKNDWDKIDLPVIKSQDFSGTAFVRCVQE